MKKHNRILLPQKDLKICPVLNRKSVSPIRPNSASSSLVNKSTSSHNIIGKISVPKPQQAIKKQSSKSKENVKLENSESIQLLSSLKNYILRPTKELNEILKEIPRFTARKIQDLKKGYKSNENFDNLASCFLTIFAEIDPELGKEMASLRKKIGEMFTGYLSNSGNFIRSIRNMHEVLKKCEANGKVINDALKYFENVSKTKLSCNYQDLYTFLSMILDYLKKSKSPQRPLSDLNSSFSYTLRRSRLVESPTFSKEIFSNTCTYKTLDTQNSEISPIDYTPNPLSCTNRSLTSKSLLQKPPRPSPSPTIFKISETPKSSNLKTQILKSTSASSSHNKTVIIQNKSQRDLIKRKISQAKKKEWEELRQIKKNKEAEKREKLIGEMNLAKSESQKFKAMMAEKLKKEKEEEKRFKEEELREEKRIRNLNELKVKKEMEDDIKRNLEKLRVSRKSEI